MILSDLAPSQTSQVTDKLFGWNQDGLRWSSSFSPSCMFPSVFHQLQPPDFKLFSCFCQFHPNNGSSPEMEIGWYNCKGA